MAAMPGNPNQMTEPEAPSVGAGRFTFRKRPGSMMCSAAGDLSLTGGCGP